MSQLAHHHNTFGEVAMDVAKVSPPVAATTWTVSGHALNEWLVLVTIVYTLLMIVHELWTWNRR